AEAAAFSIFAVSNETMINAIKDITVSEGIDPSEAVVVAGGGAAGFNIVPIARELECRSVIVPRTASVLSACGMQFSNIQVEQSATLATRSDSFDMAAVNSCLDRIDESLEAFIEKLAARGFDQREIHYRVDAHYAAQVWDIAIDLPTSRLNSKSMVDELIEAFHANHRRIFSVDDRASPIEFLNWTGRLAIRLPQTKVAASTRVKETGSRTSRIALFDIDEPRETMIVRGDSVRIGELIDGPAIIEEATTTIVVPPGVHATLSSADSYLLEWGSDID
ncbi:MAG: hydantoinase/oxoprolinase family protein, partial [Gammaproteobacteria bacterium]